MTRRAARAAAVLVAVAVVAVIAAGCGRVNFDPIELPECAAQRAVYVVAGNGSLAYFTLVWPAPAVITGFQVDYSYDDPTLAMQVVADADHPLYARHALWTETPAAQPSAIVAGFNETHTSTPISIVQSSGTSVIAAGVDAQGTLAAPLPALGFGALSTYVPNLVVAADVDGAVAALRAVAPLSEADELALRPDAATLATWVGANVSASNLLLAERLLFAANAFRAGLIGSVLIERREDPHEAFEAGTASTDADDLVGVLRGFQGELASADEPVCHVDGAPASLADNVVVVVFGDTPKNSFVNVGWPDGTPGNSNWLYVRSNGFLRPGWFGSVTPAGRVGFDPATGLLDAAADQTVDAAAAARAIHYAVTRGDTAAVTAFAPGPFEGLTP